jgi:diguanylate cyclase (GGDEF)-like protein
MLSVPTLWLVFVVNFVAIGLVWTYVSRSYPNFDVARYWAAAVYLAALGAAISMLRGVMHPVLPMVVAGVLLTTACSIAAMGFERFYRLPISWRFHAIVVAFNAVGLAVFAGVWPDTGMRIVIYSICQSIVLAKTLKLSFSGDNGRPQPGARLAGGVALLIIAVNIMRGAMAVFGVGGPVSLVEFNQAHAVMVLMLVFLSMMWNFGFLLMAIDRLRAEVADLAMFDDLTGAANRRQLLVRLDEECARSHRSFEPFALLMIDLDGFKEINDSHGHAAGDECLRRFTRAAQSRLRTGDLLARMGGDEFCVVLPATTLREGAVVARHILEACNNDPATWHGVSIGVAASIGVAQWRPEIGHHPERLVAAADRALYTAKKDGKNGYAVFDVTPLESGSSLRKSA